MKALKSFLIFLFGGGAIYLTLSWQPSWLITISAEPAADTTQVVAAPVVPEVSPAVTPAADTSEADTAK